jgi:hypothetical protein
VLQANITATGDTLSLPVRITDATRRFFRVSIN